MSKQAFTIHFSDGITETRVMADHHRQHIHSRTTLVGVSPRAVSRLRKLIQTAGTPSLSINHRSVRIEAIETTDGQTHTFA